MAVVLCLAPYKFLPAKNGGQKNIAFFYKYFSRNVRLITLTTKDNQNELADGYETIKFWMSSKLRYINPFYIFSIRQLIKKEKATHLLIEHPYIGWLAILLKRETGVKLVVHSHNIESLRFKSLNKWWWKVLWYYEKWVHRCADYNLFIQDADLRYGINNYSLSPDKCKVITFGIERRSAPSKEEIEEARQVVRKSIGLEDGEKLILFVGAFNYQPNINALDNIEYEILPRLEKKNFSFKIVICGAGLADRIPPTKNIVYAGYVEDVELYFKATDVFINPVIEGGGIKTKLVEALANNANVVSTEIGAIGVDPDICNEKLAVTQDNDWDNFTTTLIRLSELRRTIQTPFFMHFYWGYNTKQAADFISY